MNDGDAKTACQTSCPTSAIVFGNIHDKSSAINKVRDDNNQRKFYVLEQLHVLPSISYLAKVRNTEELVGEKENSAKDEHPAMPAATKPEETH